MPQSLSLDSIIHVQYNVSPIAAARRGFNLGLIMGNSTVIPALERIRIYGSDALTTMIDDGFTVNSAEYKAVQLYFQATSKPIRVAVGVIGAGETVLEAVMAARKQNPEWYTLNVVGVGSDSDMIGVAGFIEGCTPYTTLIHSSDDSAIPANATGNIVAALKALKYRRTLPIYSTTEHASAATAGYVAGQTSTLRNTYYTLDNKQLPGVVTDALSETQYENIINNNGNCYVNRGLQYDVFQEGRMSNGAFFDEVIYGDMLINFIQLNEMDLLYQSPAVPNTEPGTAMIRHVAANACEQLRNIGFIAPGQWNGADIGGLKTGQQLQNGYEVFSDPVSSQSQADREARKAVPTYIPIKQANAIHRMDMLIQVNR